MSKIFITSDTHFGHKNIAGPAISSWKHGYRNYGSVAEMNEAILDAINSKVGPDDVLYHLGDFAMGDKKLIPGYREAIKCREIHLVYGNHDGHIRKAPNLQALFSSVQDYKEMRHNGILFCLMHFAMHIWPEHAGGAIHLFGHSHGSLGPQERKREDVGIDNHPEVLTMDEYVELLKDRVVFVLDHHTKQTPTY